MVTYYACDGAGSVLYNRPGVVCFAGRFVFGKGGMAHINKKQKALSNKRINRIKSNKKIDFA